MTNDAVINDAVSNEDSREHESNERAFQALADTLHVPKLKIIEVYKTEYGRIAAQARIDTFVSVLAMRNTRSILRGSVQ